MPEKKIHLLLVEDVDTLREATAEHLEEHGYQVTQAASGEAALEHLAGFAFDIVVTDLRLPGIDGTQLIETAVQQYPDLIGIVVTGYGTIKDAVEAIRRGARDFITKPFQFAHLRHILESAIEQRRLQSENAYLRSQLEDRYRFEGIVGRSAPMRQLFALLETVAAASSTVLVTGETGTGKELVAKAIHHNSPRRRERFVALNCGAIPETLLEAELFGHVRGAFTGAVANRQGRLEQAHKGTFFLDEVGTMSAGLQAKLLRVLQEREFERIGDGRSVRIDVRVIAATNSDITKLVRDGAFREDLFYRLNVLPIHLPPLRERREDIPLLVHAFLQKMGRNLAPPRPEVVFSQEALRRMMAFDWPGNIRQLENVVERTLVLTPGRTQFDVVDLPHEIVAGADQHLASAALPEGGLDLQRRLQEVERAIVRQALEQSGGNKHQAARLLNVKRTTLVEKVKRLRI